MSIEIRIEGKARSQEQKQVISHQSSVISINNLNERNISNDPNVLNVINVISGQLSVTIETSRKARGSV